MHQSHNYGTKSELKANEHKVFFIVENYFSLCSLDVENIITVNCGVQTVSETEIKLLESKYVGETEIRRNLGDYSIVGERLKYMCYRSSRKLWSITDDSIS